MLSDIVTDSRIRAGTLLEAVILPTSDTQKLLLFLRWGFHFVVEADLKFRIFLPQPPESSTTFFNCKKKRNPRSTCDITYLKSQLLRRYRKEGHGPRPTMAKAGDSLLQTKLKVEGLVEWLKR